MTDYYQLLNLQSTAKPDEIKAAYARERARLLSNETENNKEQTAEQLEAVDEAYATLVDPNQRAAYDRSLSADSQARELAVTGQSSSLVLPQPPPVSAIQQACPHCGELNPAQATSCSKCGGQVSRPCPHCGQAVVLGQTVCPRCNTLIPEYDERRFAEALATEQRVQQERRTSEAHVHALEASHRANARRGVFFWLVVLALCLGLTILAFSLYGYFTQLYQ